MHGGRARTLQRLFSYHWRDHAVVEAVARALTERGLRVFLDRWYLAPGQPWPQALERALASCGSVAVFFGVDGLGPWQQRERDLALERQAREPAFPVIPVLLTTHDPALGFLTLHTWVDLSAGVGDGAALDALCAAVRGRPSGPLALQRAAAVRAEVCPYRGLHRVLRRAGQSDSFERRLRQDDERLRSARKSHRRRLFRRGRASHRREGRRP